MQSPNIGRVNRKCRRAAWPNESLKPRWTFSNFGDESVSVFGRVRRNQRKGWKDNVYKPDILGQPENSCKKPGYIV